MWKQILDPSVIFIAGCFMVPLGLAEDNAERIRFLTDWTLWFMVACAVGTVLITRWVAGPNPVPLSNRDRLVASWFLMNGAVIHIFMDGLIGVYRLCPPFQRHYAKLDDRYGKGDATVDNISLLELYLYGPAALALYYAYHNRRAWRYPLEIVVSCFQLYGAILFVFTEAWYGGIHIPVDWKFEFHFDHILYFWFGFLIANGIWFVVPSWIIYGSSKHIVTVLNSVGSETDTVTETVSFVSPNGTRGTSTSIHTWKSTKVNGSANGHGSVNGSSNGTNGALKSKLMEKFDADSDSAALADEVDQAMTGLLRGSVYEATEHMEKAGRALSSVMSKPIAQDDEDEEEAPKPRSRASKANGASPARSRASRR